jgi:hypothetical protein
MSLITFFVRGPVRSINLVSNSCTVYDLDAGKGICLFLPVKFSLATKWNRSYKLRPASSANLLTIGSLFSG